MFRASVRNLSLSWGNEYILQSIFLCVWKYCWTSIFSQDGITETELTLLSKTTKKLNKIYKAMVVKTLNTRQWSLRGRKQMRWALQLPQCTTVLRQPPGHGWEVETSRLPELRRQSHDPGGSKAARVGRMRFRRELHRGTPEICRKPQECSAECWSGYACDLPISPPLRKSGIPVS